MKSIFDSIAHWLLVVAVLLVLLLSWGVDHYRSKARAATTDLQQLQADVRAQNTTAKTTLERLTGERDTAQTALNQLHKQQEKNDVTSTNEIARLSDELKHRPVRVRVVTASGGGASGGCTSGDAATSSASAPFAASSPERLNSVAIACEPDVDSPYSRPKSRSPFQPVA